jgi:hypothetical protein
MNQNCRSCWDESGIFFIDKGGEIETDRRAFAFLGYNADKAFMLGKYRMGDGQS